jgi:hypothetical protein
VSSRLSSDQILLLLLLLLLQATGGVFLVCPLSSCTDGSSATSSLNIQIQRQFEGEFKR